MNKPFLFTLAGLALVACGFVFSKPPNQAPEKQTDFPKSQSAEDMVHGAAQQDIQLVSSVVSDPQRRVQEDELQKLREEKLYYKKKYEDMLESASYDAVQSEKLMEEYYALREENRRLRAILGENEWVRLSSSPVYEELTEDQREHIYSFLKELGEPLTNWQVLELARVLPELHAEWNDLSNRLSATRKGKSNNHPEVLNIKNERKKYREKEIAEMRRILGSETLVQKYLDY